MNTNYKKGVATSIIIIFVVIVALIAYLVYSMSKDTGNDSQIIENTETNTEKQSADTEGISAELNSEIVSDSTMALSYNKYSDAIASGKNLKCSLSTKGFDGVEKEIGVSYFSSDKKIRKESYGTFSGVTVYTEDKIYNQPDISVDDIKIFTGAEAKTYWDKLMTQSITNYECEEAMVSDSMFVL